MNKFYELSDNTLINLEQLLQVTFIEINDEDENGIIWEAGLNVMYKNGTTFDTKSTSYDSTRFDYEQLKKILV